MTHVWHNSTQQRKEDIEDHKNLRNCYYKGVVRGDPSSKVSVNLCGGMVSYQSCINNLKFEPLNRSFQEFLLMILIHSNVNFNMNRNI